MLLGMQVIIPLYVSNKHSIAHITMVDFQVILHRLLSDRQGIHPSRHPTFQTAFHYLHCRPQYTLIPEVWISSIKAIHRWNLGRKKWNLKQLLIQQ
jgi:hypothetical protein